MTAKHSVVIALAALVALAAGVLIVADPFAAKTPALKPADPAVLALGESIYKAQCASCHGAQLQGQPDWRTRGADGLLPAPPHDASGHTWHHPDETLFRITKYGVAKTAGLADYASAMPIYEGVLSDEQIVAVLSWIKAQWPAQVRDKHDQINAQQRTAAVR
jgi:mono/diheme cytochrome c family protein